MRFCAVCGQRGNIIIGGEILCSLHAEAARRYLARQKGKKRNVIRYVYDARKRKLFSLRLSQAEKDLLVAASKKDGSATIAGFIRKSALIRAREILK